MNKFKVGDKVKHKTIKRLVGRVIQVVNNSHLRILWTDNQFGECLDPMSDIILCEKKKIKPFGIVSFCNKYYK